MKFHVKFWCLKDKKVTRQGKNLILGKKPKIWSWQKIYSIDLLFLVVYMMHFCCFGMIL